MVLRVFGVTGTLVACVAVLAGCGGSTTIGTQATASQGSVVAQSPLDGLLGLGIDLMADEMQFNDETRQREVLVQSCMGQAGFEYHPEPPDTSRGATIDGPFEIAAGAGDDPEASQKNDAYRSSLTAEERESYDMALAGVPSLDREGLTAEEMEWYDTDGDGDIADEKPYLESCLNRASQELPGVYELEKQLGDGVVDGFRSDRDRAVTDAGVLSALADCLTDSGIESVTEANAVERLSSEDGIHDTPGVSACVAAFKQGVAESTIAVDRAFYEAHRAVIDAYGVWSGN